ncbi:hypothetical protein [Paenibacillus agricola]|nr:hypothetical protein [Paenibacillus agricola]
MKEVCNCREHWGDRPVIRVNKKAGKSERPEHLLLSGPTPHGCDV